MRCVDAVAVFEDDEPSATLARLRPHVWVKGGDYLADELPEAPVVRGYGGRIEIVPLLDGRSTTAVLARAGGGMTPGGTAGRRRVGVPVLALRAIGLGDALTGVPALRALRRRFAPRPLLLAAPTVLGRWLTDLDVVDGFVP